jgi:predicted O-methyltransferase YrrM
VFVPGFFQDTLPRLQAGPFALIRLDGDMYESTIVALDNLYPKLSPGGFVVIDDYALPTCKAAVDDFRRDHRITSPVHPVDWTGLWWQKT